MIQSKTYKVTNVREFSKIWNLTNLTPFIYIIYFYSLKTMSQYFNGGETRNPI